MVMWSCGHVVMWSLLEGLTTVTTSDRDHLKIAHNGR